MSSDIQTLQARIQELENQLSKAQPKAVTNFTAGFCESKNILCFIVLSLISLGLLAHNNFQSAVRSSAVLYTNSNLSYAPSSVETVVLPSNTSSPTSHGILPM